MQPFPEPGRPAPGDRVLLEPRAAQPDHVLGRVVAPDIGPPRVGLPRLTQIGRLLADCLHDVMPFGIPPGGVTPPVTPPRMGESLPHCPLAGASPRDGTCGAGCVSGGGGGWSALTVAGVGGPVKLSLPRCGTPASPAQ